MDLEAVTITEEAGADIDADDEIVVDFDAHLQALQEWLGGRVDPDDERPVAYAFVRFLRSSWPTRSSELQTGEAISRVDAVHPEWLDVTLALSRQVSPLRDERC